LGEKKNAINKKWICVLQFGNNKVRSFDVALLFNGLVGGGGGGSFLKVPGYFICFLWGFWSIKVDWNGGWIGPMEWSGGGRGREIHYL
jgi:hypothetical protein